MYKISVIIPVYNAERTISATIESVKNQTSNSDFEIIIINDGSTDRSDEVIKKIISENQSLNIIYLQQKNLGVSMARNSGLKISTGDYIALLDADDVWLPEKTERQLSYISNSKLAIDFLATRRNNKKLLFPYSSKSELVKVSFRKLLFRNEITVPSVIFKRKILENTGYFDEKQRYAEDVNYYLRISKNNTIYILNESLIIAGNGKPTFGSSGLSANLLAMHKGFVRNLNLLHEQKRLNFVELCMYIFFYKLKYLVLRVRTSYFKSKEKRSI